MKIAIVYVYPNLLHQTYDRQAKRFAGHYVSNPPGESDHELYVVVNGGGTITPRQESLFHPLAPKYLYHDNSGKDVGAHRMAAKSLCCDLILLLGAPCWPAKAGWLDHIVMAYENHGPALYGNFCFHQPKPHVRTTCYWAPPQIISSSTLPVHNDLRYEWEHGQKSITRHCMKLGFPVLQVTWRGVFSIENWSHVPERDCLFFDQHTERIGYGRGK